MHIKTVSFLLLVAGGALGQAPQAPNPTQQSVVTDPNQPVPIFKVTVVSRTTKAINYHHRSGATNIDFRGTELLPEARGEARVESKQGVIKIDARMEKLLPATRFGPEYITYVMWAITPEGRATNVGEVLLNGTHSKLNATTELQSFSLIVTAEPYFAVTQPSDVVVMENFVRNDTTGTIENVEAKFELLKRGQYTLTASPEQLRKPWFDRKTPIELQEARNAVQIARWAGAEQYAADTFQKAVIGLQNAEGYLIGKGGKKPIGTVAREAVQMAEDARIITVKRREEEQLAAERTASANREATSKANADQQMRLAQMETQRRAQAESDRQAAEQAKAEAMRAKQDALAAADQSARLAQVESQRRAQAEGERQAAEQAKQAADQARQAAEQAKAEAMRAKQEALAAVDQATKLKLEAEAARAAAMADEQVARAEAAKSRAASVESDRLRQKAEGDREQMRGQLLQQFNLILETRDTARGLIVNMSDVLFDFNQHTLRPGAREKLAKISGIVLAHPGLRLEVEGHTDSIGTDDYNQNLSEKRAEATRNFLVQQGVAANTIASRGLGKTQPVATNDTAEGRQRNRRVELVVSGDIIGTQITAPSAPNRIP